jgi:hypothetical protein
MYEIGLAHAVRRPEEVLLFRSDTGPLVFDVANIRVNHYDPDGSADQAVATVADAIVVALKEVELQKQVSVRAVAESLDYQSWMVLFEISKGAIHHPTRGTVRSVLGSLDRITAIRKLLDLGTVRSQFSDWSEFLNTPEDFPPERLVSYDITAFGEAVIQHAAKTAFGSPKLARLIEELNSAQAPIDKPKNDGQ